ncbi:MAG: hypothetical protein JWM85_2830 [Acidimicrobiaceae bacterium]|nr:hypothetical protein [Acidimicrobiaceae bacterium]
MIAVAVGVVLFVVVVGAAWARFSASRAERRSLDTYERTLDLLGDVAKRSDASADVHPPAAADLARPHVRPALGHAFPGPAASAVRMVPPPRVRLVPPVLPGHPAAPLPVFGDADLAGEPDPTFVSLPDVGDLVAPDFAVADGADPKVVDDPLTQIIEVVRADEPVTGDVVPAGDDTVPLGDTVAVPVVAPLGNPEPVAAPAPLEPVAESEPGVGAGESADEAHEDEALVFDFDDTTEREDVIVRPGRMAMARIQRARATRAARSREARVARPSEARVARPSEERFARPSEERVARPGDDRTVRRAATGAAAAVVLGAIVVGGVELASHKSPTPVVQSSGPSTTVPTSGRAPAAGHPKARSTPATTPTTFRPTSTSSTLVTYQAPAGSYTVSFTATAGECWLGAQQQANSSAYLQMWTLTPGQTATYKASGPLVVKIGAPKYVTIKVNGKPVVLPPGNVQAYDISFTTGAGTSV